MYPLMVEGGVGELLNSFLRYVEPIGDGNFLADEILKSVWGVEYAFGHKINLCRPNGARRNTAAYPPLRIRAALLQSGLTSLCASGA